MRKLFSFAFLGALVCAAAAANDLPSPRLESLTQHLPALGQVVPASLLGLNVTVGQAPPSASGNETSYNFVIPANLDNDSTDLPPYAGKYPGLHLNLPLAVRPSYVNYLFLSDQPEFIRDDRKRTPAVSTPQVDPGPGVVGIYSRSSIPPRSTVRTLVDHSNGTKRNLHLWLLWCPEKDGFLTVSQRSLTVLKDSLAAGNRSFMAATQVNVEPRHSLQADQCDVLFDTVLRPDETAVAHFEHYSDVGGSLVCLVTEEGQAPPQHAADLDALPVLHSVVWNEEEERLTKFINPDSDPKRFDRIRFSFQHARGDFHFPDRWATSHYNVASWDEQQSPLQAYTLFESVPGSDETVQRQGAPAETDNRGNYGARVGLRLKIDQLPPGCQEAALLIYNRGDVYGGRHWVSNGRDAASEVDFRSPDSTLTDIAGSSGLLRKDMVGTLWRGKVQKGDTLTMWTEPIANSSVHVWYLLVPLPP